MVKLKAQNASPWKIMPRFVCSSFFFLPFGVGTTAKPASRSSTTRFFATCGSNFSAMGASWNVSPTRITWTPPKGRSFSRIDRICASSRSKNSPATMEASSKMRTSICLPQAFL